MPGSRKSLPSSPIAGSLAIGIALGVAIGVSLNNVVPGIGVGIAIGLAISGWRGARTRMLSDRNEAEDR